jgi:ADP-ribose pyrophosphatase
MNFKVTKSETLFHGKVFDLRVDNIEYNSGNTGIREVAVHPGGAVVVPLKDDGKIILVKQYRYPFKKTMVEVPAGKLDENEDPYLCAKRELEEETGYTAKEVVKLGSINTTPGFCTEELHIFLARGLKEGDHKREEGEEEMEVMELPLNEVEEMIISGEITDSKTICGIYMTKRFLAAE